MPITTAKANGLSTFRVIFKHAFKNSLIPTVTIAGLSLGELLGGAILTETIFSWPGVGKWLIESIGRRDYPALQGGIMLVHAVNHRPRMAGKSNYGVWNRLWVGLVDVLGVWWLKRRAKVVVIQETRP